MENDQNKKYNQKGAQGGRGVKKYPVDRNFTPKSDRPYGDRPHGDRPYGDRPHGDRPYGSRPRGDRPFGDRSAGDRPFTKKPYENKPHYDRSLGDRPRAGFPTEESAERADRRFPADRIPNKEILHRPLPVTNESDADEDEEETMDEDSGLVIGRNAVRELLRSGRTIDKLLVRRGDREGSITVLVAEAVDRGIPVVEVDKSKLDDMSGFVPHQGVIAMVAQKEYVSVEDILAIAAERNEKPLIVIADGITDPYNLGALIRCAEGVGAHGLIIPRRRAVGLTALVAKSSAGAMEHLAVAKVSNIAGTIAMLQREGVWCYAAEAGGKAYYETDFKGPCALVFGSEGNGVSHIVKEKCDGIVSIPMYGKVNSFNVSTAAAVVLSEAAKQHRS